MAEQRVPELVLWVLLRTPDTSYKDVYHLVSTVGVFMDVWTLTSVD